MAEDAARSSQLVAQAGRDLRDALGEPERERRAVDRLAEIATSNIELIDQTVAERAAAGVAAVPEDTEALLAATLSQLDVAGTMFAASEAVGEHGPARPQALAESLGRSDTTVALLTTPSIAATSVAPTASATVADALAALQRQLGRTVEDLIGRTTTVISGSLTGIHDRGPEQVRKAWDLLNQKLHLDELGGKLCRIGLRAFRAALALLARVVPAKWLTGIRANVDRLIADVDRRGAGKTAVGLALGADRLAELAKLDPSTLDIVKLDRGTGDLTELGTRYGKLMDLCGGIGTAIGVAAKLTTVLRLTIPQLGVIILSAHVLVIGSVLVLGRDHVDAGVDTGSGDGGHGLVRGVRTIVAEATAG